MRDRDRAPELQSSNSSDATPRFREDDPALLGPTDELPVSTNNSDPLGLVKMEVIGGGGGWAGHVSPPFAISEKELAKCPKSESLRVFRGRVLRSTSSSGSSWSFIVLIGGLSGLTLERCKGIIRSLGCGDRNRDLPELGLTFSASVSDQSDRALLAYDLDRVCKEGR